MKVSTACNWQGGSLSVTQIVGVRHRRCVERQCTVEEAYLKWSDALVRYATALVGAVDAADLVADVFVGLLDRGEAVWDKVRDPQPYLFRSVTNAARMHARSRSRRLARDSGWSSAPARGELIGDPAVATALSDGAVPDADFYTSVVVHFAPAESSSCPIGPLDSIRFDPTTERLFPVYGTERRASADPEPSACTDDANPHAVVVAVDRSNLPTTDFEIWVNNDTPPGCCTDSILRVTAGELVEPPPTTTTLGPASGAGPTTESIVSDLGVVSFVLPVDVGPDPMPMPVMPDFVVGYGKWFVECCYLKIALQSLDPPFTEQQRIGGFQSGDMTWTVYDIGPEDGTQIVAKATEGAVTVLVMAQVRFADEAAEGAAQTVAEQVARSVVVTDTDGPVAPN